MITGKLRPVAVFMAKVSKASLDSRLAKEDCVNIFYKISDRDDSVISVNFTFDFINMTRLTAFTSIKKLYTFTLRVLKLP